MDRDAKTPADPRLKRELATRAFKLARATDAFGREEEVKSPWYHSHGDARGNSIMQAFETKETAIDATEQNSPYFDDRGSYYRMTTAAAGS